MIPIAAGTPALAEAGVVADAEVLAQNMLSAAGRLADALAAENVCFATGDVAAVHALCQRRREIAGGYTQALQSLADGIAGGASPAPATDRALKMAMERLRPLLAENARGLAAFIAARERVLAVIAEAVREAGPGVRSYGRSGTARTVRHLPAPALSVNCTL